MLEVVDKDPALQRAELCRAEASTLPLLALQESREHEISTLLYKSLHKYSLPFILILPRIVLIPGGCVTKAFSLTPLSFISCAGAEAGTLVLDSSKRPESLYYFFTFLGHLLDNSFHV